MLKSAVNAIRKLHSAKIQILRAAAHTCVSIELESLEVSHEDQDTPGIKRTIQFNSKSVKLSTIK